MDSVKYCLVLRPRLLPVIYTPPVYKKNINDIWKSMINTFRQFLNKIASLFKNLFKKKKKYISLNVRVKIDDETVFAELLDCSKIPVFHSYSYMLKLTHKNI